MFEGFYIVQACNKKAKNTKEVKWNALQNGFGWNLDKDGKTSDYLIFLLDVDLQNQNCAFQKIFFLNSYFWMYPKTIGHMIRLHTNNTHTNFLKQYISFGCATFGKKTD